MLEFSDGVAANSTRWGTSFAPNTAMTASGRSRGASASVSTTTAMFCSRALSGARAPGQGCRDLYVKGLSIAGPVLLVNRSHIRAAHPGPAGPRAAAGTTPGTRPSTPRWLGRTRLPAPVPAIRLIRNSVAPCGSSTGASMAWPGGQIWFRLVVSTRPSPAGSINRDTAARSGALPNTSSVLVCQTASPGTELALGIARDPALGPLLVIGTGGVFIEIFPNGPWCFPRSPSQPLWPYRTGSGSPDPQRRARAARRRPGRDRRRDHRPVSPGLRPGRPDRGPGHQPADLRPVRRRGRRRPGYAPRPAFSGLSLPSGGAGRRFSPGRHRADHGRRRTCLAPPARSAGA